MTEQEFIHDLVNPLSIVFGRLKFTIKKEDQYTKEEIVKILSETVSELERSFKVINDRMTEISE